MSDREKPFGAGAPSGRKADERNKKKEETRLQRLRDRLDSLDPTTVPGRAIVQKGFSRMRSPKTGLKWAESFTEAPILPSQ